MYALAAGRKIVQRGSRRPGAATVCRTALTVAILLMLAPCATANAASPSRIQKTAYTILQKTFKGVRAVTVRQVNQGAAAAQQQLTPCLAALNGNSVPQGAAQALADELGAQYTAMALGPVLELVIAEDIRTERLPVGPKLKAALQTEVTQGTALFQLNTCADVAAWQAAGFAPSSVPSGTRLATAYLSTPPAGAEGTLYHILSARQRRTLNPIRKKADKHAQALAAAVIGDLAGWLG
jgi:hypothetical protein